MWLFEWMQRRYGLAVFMMCFVTVTAGAQQVPTAQLGVMPTADTLGKGGYMTSFGLYQFDKTTVTPDVRQRVVIGNLEEQQLVELELETFLVPVRFTYGIGEQLDLILGATFSTGDATKTVPNFFGEGLGIEGRRVYDQPIFDGLIGLKYNIKPDVNDGLPSLSVGGDVQIGYTADNKLNSDEEFLDHTPADGLPFFGVYTYLVGSQRFGQIIRAHASVGSFLSSKSLKSTDSFVLNWQVGGELAFSDNLWLVGDFSREIPMSGLTISNLISIGFRYELSESAAFNIGYVSEPGFQFYLTVGGKGQETGFPGTPGGGELLF